MLFVDNEFNRSMGLGNKLFSWSRAYCTTQLLDAIQIEPRWFALRNAAFLRGGIDYSKLFGKIFLYGNFTSDPEAIGRLYSELEGRFRTGHAEIHYLSELSEISSHSFSDGDRIIYRADRAHHFSDLAMHHGAIKEKLETLSRRSVKWVVPVKPFIAINYRSGNDFKDHSTNNSQAKTDLNWFINAVECVRHQYGNLPVHVISDGATLHVADLIRKISNSQVHQFNTAIEDLLFLSNAKVLLASGNSSFCAWASFLSGADSFSSKATPLDKWQINSGNPNQIVGTID